MVDIKVWDWFSDQKNKLNWCIEFWALDSVSEMAPSLAFFLNLKAQNSMFHLICWNGLLFWSQNQSQAKIYNLDKKQRILWVNDYLVRTWTMVLTIPQAIFKTGLDSGLSKLSVPVCWVWTVNSRANSSKQRKVETKIPKVFHEIRFM